MANLITDRSAYQSESILAEGITLSNDTWSTGLNCNQLVLGPSGSGKTRNFLKPNLLQANASFLVLDTKGLLYRELGPILSRLGYDVQMIDFAEVGGTVGYDPLDHVERDVLTGKPSERDILKVAKTLCVNELTQDPFWDNAAANYLASFIAAVLETHSPKKQRFDNVVSLFEYCASERGEIEAYFSTLARTWPDSFAVRLYRRARCTQGADKMHSSIMGIIAEKLMCLGFEEATALFRNPNKVDFAAMGHGKVALFVCVSDTDYSLAPLTSLFVTQALQGLVKEADSCPGGMLPVPVRLFLDDFSNLCVQDFDKVISITRSREIWCTVLCQSVSQLQSLYGTSGAETIMGNCDTQLVLAFQDNTTTTAYMCRAGRTPDTLLSTPLDEAWLFVRGRRPRKVHKYDVTKHENFEEPEAGPADESFEEPEAGPADENIEEPEAGPAGESFEDPDAIESWMLI